MEKPTEHEYEVVAIVRMKMRAENAEQAAQIALHSIHTGPTNEAMGMDHHVFTLDYARVTVKDVVGPGDKPLTEV